MKNKYIEKSKTDLAKEFCLELGIDYDSKYDEIVSMSCYTILYKIADDFKDGEFREDILNLK